MRETLLKARNILRPIYGDRETEAIIRLMFRHLKGWDTVGMLMHGGDTLSDWVRGEADAMLARLARREPIQYITGLARFHGLDIAVNPSVLIPRPETAELVDIVADMCGDRPDLRVLDICTGSGCIAVALARALRWAHVSGLDISPAAVETARANARSLKTPVDFFTADVFVWKPEPLSLDAIVSNPPYIDLSERATMDANVLDYEPAAALFVPDADPVVFYRRITEIAAGGLVPGGLLAFEINPRHAGAVMQLAADAGFTDVQSLRDSYGHTRFVTARASASY